jgi:hypothetical protein
LQYISKYVLTRYAIIRFLLYSRLGLQPYDLGRAVKKLPKVWVNLKRTPTREEVRSILLECDLRMKTLFSLLISTGARIGEILSIRKDQINWSKTPVEVNLKANKIYRNRIVFLSSETVMLLKEYLQRRKNSHHQYIFSGYLHRTSSVYDRPISRNCAWMYFRRICAKIGLTQKFDRTHYFYRPNVFRVLNLDILKSEGYPSDWAEYLVGHSINFHASYLPTTSSLAKEWLKHDRAFCFLTADNPSRDEMVPSQPVRNLQINSGGNAPKLELASDGHRSLTTRWRTKNFDYVKTDIRSIEYDQAITNGFSIFDSSPSGLRVFRKRFRGGKQWMKSVNRMLVPKRTAFKKDGKPL